MQADSTVPVGQATIWVHAEAFGYGPSALALTILPKLRKLATASGGPVVLEYIGEGHTLELNTSPPWDKVHKCSVLSPEGKEALINLVRLHRPSLIISSVDEPFAEVISKLESTRLVVIDQLLWSWPSIPKPWRTAAKIVAVNYIGVHECILKEHLDNAVVVPPLLPPTETISFTGPRKGTLINLGGLRNPFTPLSQNVAYATLILHVVKSAVETRNDPDDLPVQCIVSQEVNAGINSRLASSTTPTNARNLLARSKTAFLTSGRTNIYDAADCGGRVIFLPPTNKTQGLQPRLLKEKLGCSLTCIDWHDLNDTQHPIDYKLSAEDACFSEIRCHLDALLEDKAAQERFLELVLASLETAQNNVDSLQKFFSTFGRDDGTLVASAIADADLGFKVLE
ncbi:hypothetical protein GGI35DRAFT_462671 [Trichoderma velutinum]